MEIVFPVIQKKALTLGDFSGHPQLCSARLREPLNLTSRPFNWKFTADDLTALLHRISRREHARDGQQPDLPQAA